MTIGKGHVCELRLQRETVLSQLFNKGVKNNGKQKAVPEDNG